MNHTIFGQLTLYFDCPFWVAVFEVKYYDLIQTCRVVLGSSEPKDYEIYDFVLKQYYNLQFSQPLKTQMQLKPKILNPKRQQREIKKSIRKQGISTKSQEAIRLERERNKLEKKTGRKNKKMQMQKEKFLMKQEKKKQKRRGH